MTTLSIPLPCQAMTMTPLSILDHNTMTYLAMMMPPLPPRRSQYHPSWMWMLLQPSMMLLQPLLTMVVCICYQLTHDKMPCPMMKHLVLTAMSLPRLRSERQFLPILVLLMMMMTRMPISWELMTSVPPRSKVKTMMMIVMRALMTLLLPHM